jgi:hypothetical protein
MILTPKGRGLGRRPDSPAKDLRFFSLHPEAAAVPPARKVDLRGALPPAYDQGAIGSCGAVSGAALMKFLWPEVDRFSALGLYYDVRTIENDVQEDGGVETRDVFRAMMDYGVAPEADWPYDPAKFAQPLPFQYARDADQFRIGTYSRLQSEAEMLGCLATGFPFILGFETPDYLDSDELARHGVFWLTDAPPKIISGHDVLVVGCDLDFRTNPDFLASGVDPAKVPGEALLIRNSWGADWGLQGHFWMPLAYASNPSTGGDAWAGRRGAANAAPLPNAPMVDGVIIQGHFVDQSKQGAGPMATPTKLLAAELAAGEAAAKAYLDANIPGWERRFIPDDKIQEVVVEIVNAVDDVRNKATP